MATQGGLETVLTGLTFPEGPRWHQGRLWFSDFYTHRVMALSPEGWAETMAHVPQQPSGLGWRINSRAGRPCQSTSIAAGSVMPVKVS